MSKRTPTPSPQIQHQLVAVVDLGEKADYSLEVRYHLTLTVPFRLTGRSGVRQLEVAHEQVAKAVRRFCPASNQPLHIWLLDEQTGEPGLFLSGLLGIRQERLSNQEADRMDRIIRPQVNHPRQTSSYRFLLKTTAHAWGCPEEFGCDEEATDEDREYAVLDGIFGSFEHCELTDADHSDEDNVYVAAEFWHGFTLELPFKAGKNSTEAQLGYILGRANELVQQESNDVQFDDLDIWLLDDSGQRTECISGWMRVKEGSQTVAEMQKWSQRSLAMLPVSIKSRAA